MHPTAFVEVAYSWQLLAGVAGVAGVVRRFATSSLTSTNIVVKAETQIDTVALGLADADRSRLTCRYRLLVWSTMHLDL